MVSETRQVYKQQTTNKLQREIEKLLEEGENL